MEMGCAFKKGKQKDSGSAEKTGKQANITAFILAAVRPLQKGNITLTTRKGVALRVRDVKRVLSASATNRYARIQLVYVCYTGAKTDLYLLEISSIYSPFVSNRTRVQVS